MRPPAWILRLVREGSVPRRQITSESEWVLEQIAALGLITEEVQGNRRRVVVRDLPALDRWVTDTYPPPAETPIAGLRAGNIARVRRSKAGLSTHDVQPLLLRWFAPDVNAPLAELTRRLGLVGLATDRIAELQLPTTWILLTVENWESFMAADYEGCTETVIVFYTGGNIASATLRALADIQSIPQYAIHFGDYDWAGLAIYRRLHIAIPSIRLYIPSNIDTLFAQFADTGLLIGQTPISARDDDPPNVHTVIDLIARYNAGLEQEIVSPPRFLPP